MHRSMFCVVGTVGILALSVSSAFGLVKRWDTGDPIGGVLTNANITIPVSLDAPSTAQEGYMGMDLDHYVVLMGGDAVQMIVGEGNDTDRLGRWDWWCSGGTVSTGGGPTTTWTAPQDGGLYDVWVLVDDDPIPFGPGEEGDRNDCPRSITFDSPDQRPAAVEAMIGEVATSGSYSGTLFGGQPDPFWNDDPVDGKLLLKTNPSHPHRTRGWRGFYKRAEIPATIIPALPGDRQYPSPGFSWCQERRGETLHDGTHYTGSPWPQYADEGSTTHTTDVSPDGGNRIYMLDMPGLSADPWGPNDDLTHDMLFVGVGSVGPHEFRDCVRMNGVRVSKGWDDTPRWTRELRAYSSPATQRQWQATVNE